MVKAAVRYTGEHFKAVNSLNRKSVYKSGIIIVLGLVLLTSWMLYKYINLIREMTSSNQDVAEICVYAVVFAVCIGILLKTTIKLAKAFFTDDKFNKMEPVKQIRNFEVTPETLMFTIDGEIEHSERRFILSGIHCAYELKEFFVIYIYEELYCIIGKREITEGSPEELRKLLYDALGDRFKINQ